MSSKNDKKVVWDSIFNTSAEPVKYTHFAPNERGVYVRKPKSVESERKIQALREQHKKRMSSLKKVTEDLRAHNARLERKK